MVVPAVLAAGGEGGMLVFLLFFCVFFCTVLVPLSPTSSSVLFLPFPGRQHKIIQDG